MRWRITVRGEGTELRGYFNQMDDLEEFARVMEPFGIVMASPAEDDYDPFASWEGGIPS